MLNELLIIKCQVEKSINKEISNLLANLSRLNDNELISLAETIVRLHKELGWNWYLDDLLDSLNKIIIKPDPFFDFVTKMQEHSLAKAIKDLSTIKIKQTEIKTVK